MYFIAVLKSQKNLNKKKSLGKKFVLKNNFFFFNQKIKINQQNTKATSSFYLDIFQI